MRFLAWSWRAVPAEPCRPRPRADRAAAALSLAGVVATLLAALPAAAPATATAATGLPPYHPSRLSHLGHARQVVVVTAPSWSSGRGTLRAYQQRAGGAWDRVLDADQVWLGANGLVAAA